MCTNDPELIVCELRDDEGAIAGPAPYQAFRLILCIEACSAPLRHLTISFDRAEIYARKRVATTWTAKRPTNMLLQCRCPKKKQSDFAKHATANDPLTDYKSMYIRNIFLYYH